MAKFNSNQLKSLAQVDHYVNDIKKKDVSQYYALKTLSDTTKNLISEVYPRHPDVLGEFRLHIAGPVLNVEQNIIQFNPLTRMPLDGNWRFNYINLNQIFLTAQVAPTSQSMILDLLVSQEHGTTAFKSIFKSGNANKIVVPVTIKRVKAVKFAIGQFFNDDMFRLDCLQTDPSCAGIEIYIQGSFNISESTTENPLT